MNKDMTMSNPRLDGPLSARRRFALWTAMIVLPFLGACSSLPKAPASGDGPPREGARANIDLDAIDDAVPRIEPRSRYGNPPYYEVSGRRYYVRASSEDYVERGIASWYGAKFHGRRTSSGEPYDMYAMTAAHTTLPLPTYVRVTHLRNGRSVVVKVNDRGPFHDNRLIDLSYVAALKLGIVSEGTGLVEVRALKADEAKETLASVDPVPTPRDKLTVYLQVGTFSDRDKAERLSQRIAEAAPHRKVQVRKADAEGRTLYRVRLGPLADADEIDRVKRELDGLGIKDARVLVD